MNYLILGGAGFIGVNFAAYFASKGHAVMLADNLSRRGSEANLAWIRQLHPSVSFAYCDVRDANETARLFLQYPEVDVVIHLAGQVAVTCSVTDPRHDFATNALGTFNVLEGIRLAGIDPVVLFASTNKVYGGMEQIRVVEQPTRYAFADYPNGIDEECLLDFHSPYGCSKGCADQYVRDYSRIYGMKTVVFRQSAIYGERQFGIEDQGWLAWFAIAACKNRNFTIYGDGKQVRDVLWVEDLVRAYEKAVEQIDAVKGQVFNIGGGPQHSVSIWREFEPILANQIGRAIPVTFSDWRPGDQKVCIMNIEKACRVLGWQPQVGIEEGTARVVQWVKTNLSIL
jgi:CDP-paratose 2-epimerase